MVMSDQPNEPSGWHVGEDPINRATQVIGDRTEKGLPDWKSMRFRVCIPEGQSISIIRYLRFTVSDLTGLLVVPSQSPAVT